MGASAKKMPLYDLYPQAKDILHNWFYACHNSCSPLTEPLLFS